MDFSKINELKPYDLNCNIFDVYSYDGLSMQELLCQFFTKINECVKTSNETIDLAQWLVNEGLKQEVALKLTTWLNDGTLENIINVTLFENLNKKIDNVSSQLEHIVVDVKNFGALGDGVTDDTVAIQNALKTLKEGGTLFFPNGVYVINGEGDSDQARININVNNVNVIGNNATILNKVQRGISTFSISSMNVKLDNLKFDGNNTSTNQIHIKNTAKNIKINNCEVCNSNQISGETVVASGIMISCGAENITINDCYIHDIVANETKVARGIYGALYDSNGKTNMKNITINNCVIESIYPKEDADGIQIQTNSTDDTELVISNCRFIKCSKRGIKIQCNGAIATNNIIELMDGMYSGISIYGNNVNVSNNKINNGDSGIGIECGSEIIDVSKNIIISNNIIKMNNTNNIGIYLTSTESKPFKNVSINSNIITNMKDGIYIKGYGELLQINNNTIDTCARYGIFNTYKLNIVNINSNILKSIAQYSIRDSGNSTSVAISNNITDGTGWSPYSNMAHRKSISVGNIISETPIQIYGTKPPESGEWRKGDIIWNNNTSISHLIGWICVSHGTPGRWKMLGQIPTRGQSQERPTLTEAENGYFFFDTTLNKPIWWNGLKWVDSTGSIM